MRGQRQSDEVVEAKEPKEGLKNICKCDILFDEITDIGTKVNDLYIESINKLTLLEGRLDSSSEKNKEKLDAFAEAHRIDKRTETYHFMSEGREEADAYFKECRAAVEEIKKLLGLVNKFYNKGVVRLNKVDDELKIIYERNELLESKRKLEDVWVAQR